MGEKEADEAAEKTVKSKTQKPADHNSNPRQRMAIATFLVSEWFVTDKNRAGRHAPMTTQRTLIHSKIDGCVPLPSRCLQGLQEQFRLTSLELFCRLSSLALLLCISFLRGH